ncbi:T9SS type A sorting domain-containing protein [Niastella caeni]|uniref:T9SS type A sorting domain-containing protein n=1 Tax=Niastella caeni TaxID=2569763 RepID=A0A4S8HL77_9BACT|nr:T9SS type A sorting domain-containing protein [Niastella caeni]THU36048.1 T9SS type A sorting domain-containing protein [Niastella caeni]
MKYISGLFNLLITAFACSSVVAQCTGNCPSGAIATLPTGAATLTAGSTYCISTTTNLSANTYTIDGTLVIQGGTITLGNVTLNKTGVILVKFGAKLIITGILTGNSTAPVSSIDNLVICNGGFIDITGSFSQGQINIAINDFGVMKVTGAWTAGSTGSNVKLGNGSLIELCSSFNLNKNGFFTETSTGISYLVVHAPMIQSVVNGFLSSLQNASKIRWTSDVPAAFVSHPAAFTCNACGNYNLAPTGTTSACGSAANAQNSIVLSVTPNQPVAGSTDITNTNEVIAFPNPSKKYIFLRLPKKHRYTDMLIFNQTGQPVHHTTIKAGTAPTRYELPAHLLPGLYYIQLSGGSVSLTIRMVKD